MRNAIGLSLALALGLTALVSVPVAANFSNGPSSAGIVERLSEPGFGVWVDEEDGLLVFANVNSLADACSGIPAGAGDVQVLTLRGGVIITLLHDDDVPLLVVPLGSEAEICGNPGAWPVIGSGTGDVRGTDNDAAVSRTRMNSFGQRVTGRVANGNGDAWSVQAHFRARITKDDEFILTREDVNLVKRGK